jgi:hypothetical protein
MIPRASPIVVTATPSTIYIERSTSAQHLQFDFVLEGQTDDTIRLTSIRMTASDRSGKPWSIRFIDESGIDPGIQTIPRREIAGRSAVLVYNPFYTFPPDAPIARLRYEFSFAKGNEEWQVATTVEPVRYRQAVTLALPLKGRMLVFDGHDFYAHHRRVDYTHPLLVRAGIRENSGRYSHDISLVDRDGKMYRTDGKRNEDWLSWGAPIVAPGAGRVVEVEDAMPDYDVGNPSAGLSLDSILARPASLMGNHVVIDHGGGVFSRLFHMMKGSVRVRPGDRVAQGQVLGQVGFSGSVYTVHLHYEAAAGPGVHAEGVPAYFSGFLRVLGSKTVPVVEGPIDTGDIVERR